MSLNLFLAGPANNNKSIILIKEWTACCAYNDDVAPIPVASATATTSFVRFTWTTDTRVPAGATHLLLRVKLKAYVPNGSGLGYCQANCRAPIAGEVMNHFLHVDEWGRAVGNSGEGRRVVFGDVWIPIINGAITIDVAHQISGRGDIEFVCYLEGYAD